MTSSHASRCAPAALCLIALVVNRAMACSFTTIDFPSSASPPALVAVADAAVTMALSTGCGCEAPPSIATQAVADVAADLDKTKAEAVLSKALEERFGSVAATGFEAGAALATVNYDLYTAGQQYNAATTQVEKEEAQKNMAAAALGFTGAVTVTGAAGAAAAAGVPALVVTALAFPAAIAVAFVAALAAAALSHQAAHGGAAAAPDSLR